MSNRRFILPLTLVGVGLALPAAAHGPGEAAKLADAAFDKAKPVFHKYCAKCHSKAGSEAEDETLEHFSIDTYPFGGHHAKEITKTLRKVLGAGGAKATMPDDEPGIVAADEVAVILAWADAYDHALAEAPAPAPSEHHPPAAQGHLPYALPREMSIPGRPGPPGSLHLMVNAFAYAQSLGLGGYTIENMGAESHPGGRAVPIFSGDWAMAYYRDRRGWAEGLLMLNFEPFTLSNGGVPELGQSGEGLWDAQHPHMLVHQAMLAVHPLAGITGPDGRYDLSLFLGQGSATIGPPIFMHRASSPGPTVPRKHHKGENPHETFPVFGAGFRLGNTVLEASVFGAEELGPDDSRLYPHPGTPNSFAARVRHTFADALEVQVSGERLVGHGHGGGTAHEASWQGSASVYAWRSFGGWRLDGLLDGAIDKGPHATTSGALLELAVRDPSRLNTLWMRGELNEREEPATRGGGVSSPWLFQSVGFEHAVWGWKGLQLGLFGEATYVRIPTSLRDRYLQPDAVTLIFGLHLEGMWMLGGGAASHLHH